MKNCWKNVGKMLKKKLKNLEKSWKIMKNLEKNAYSVLECSKIRWKNVEKMLEKCWKNVEKVWKNLEKKVEKILKKMLKKFWKYVKMSYNIMSTLKNCTARQLRLQKTSVGTRLLTTNQC